MARIFYSMAGEGRGHAARVSAMVDALRNEHEFTLFAPGDAYDLLAPAYRETNVRVLKIPGLRFHYTPKNAIHPMRTIREAGMYLLRFPWLVRKLRRIIREEHPDLIITDFEPALPKAAQECGIPYISLDHQHFLVVNDLSSLPQSLRWQAKLMGLVVRLYCRGQAETIVSSFYRPPLLPEFRDVTQVGVLLRQEILHAQPQRGTHLLAYLRRATAENVIKAFCEAGLPVRVYGLGTQPAVGPVEFRPISQVGFLEDLATCRAVVSTAGNQLVGEALYLSKPVLAMPEMNNFEQRINAHFLQASGAGCSVDPAALTARHIRDFVDHIEQYVTQIDPSLVAGNGPAVDAVRRHLEPTWQEPRNPDHRRPATENWDDTEVPELMSLCSA